MGNDNLGSNKTDLFSELFRRATDPQSAGAMASAIVSGIQEGNPSALKILERVLAEYRAGEVDTIKLTDEQLENIVTLAATRVGRLKTSA